MANSEALVDWHTHCNVFDQNETRDGMKIPIPPKGGGDEEKRNDQSDRATEHQRYVGLLGDDPPRLTRRLTDTDANTWLELSREQEI